MSIKAAGDTSFKVEGVVGLSIEIGGHNAKVGSGVASKLATKMLLGTAFIDREITRIETKSGQIIPRSEHAVAIVASSEYEDAV